MIIWICLDMLRIRIKIDLQKDSHLLLKSSTVELMGVFIPFVLFHISIVLR